MAAHPEEFGLALLQIAADANPHRIIRAGDTRTGRAPVASLKPAYRHVADRYEVMTVISGVSWMELPDGPVALNPGDLLFIEKGVEHTELLPDPPEPYTALWCHFRRNHVLLGYTHFLPDTGWRLREQLDLYGRTDVESIAVAIASELATREPGWEVCTRGLLQYLFWIVIRRAMRSHESDFSASESPALRTDSHTWEVVRSVLAQCELDTGARVDLRHIAATIGYSPSYLSRLVSRHLGRSLSRHLHERRMDRAKALLESGDLSVREVAAALRYEDPAHFSRAFTRAFGVSPRTYRRRMVGS
jgi:AraC family transcriptional regulator of arabinose operon